MVNNIIIMGPQGAGKGTQAQLLAEKYNLYHFEVGRILREKAQEDTEIGREIDKIINKKGQLVPYTMVTEIIQKTVYRVPKDKGIIFDGTPRRETEVEPLYQALKKSGRSLDHVFFIDISEQEAVRRLSRRRVCSECNKQYSLNLVDLDELQKCEECGGHLIQREDDKPLAIQKRLALYNEQTKPLLDYYRKKNLLITIQGKQSIDKVFQDIVQAL